MSSNDTANIYANEYNSTGRPIPADIIGYDNTDSGVITYAWVAEV